MLPLLLSLLSVSYALTSPCHDLPNPALVDSLATVPDLVACIESIAPDNDRFLSEIDAVRTIIENYVYLDIVHNTSIGLTRDNGAPADLSWVQCGEFGAPVAVDVLSELDRLEVLVETNAFTSDYSFFRRLRDLFQSLCDPHTSYHVPPCYSTWSFILPFRLSLTFDDPDYIIHPIPLDENDENWRLFSSETQNEILSWIHTPNLRLLSINSLDPLAYIRTESLSHSSFSRNRHARWNRFLSSEFQQRTVSRSDLLDRFLSHEESDVMRLNVTDPVLGGTREILIEWKVRNVNEINFGVLKPEILCGYYESEEKKEQEKNEITMNWNWNWNWNWKFFQSIKSYVLKRAIEQFIVMSNFDRKSASLPDPFPTPSNFERWNLPKDLKYDYFDFFSSSDNNNSITAVLRVKTFMPDIDLEQLQNPQTIMDPTELLEPFTYYILQLSSAFSKMKETNTKRLIVDVRGNLGGVACFATAVLARMISEYAPIDSAPNGDMRVTSLGSAIHCKWNYADMIANFGMDRGMVGGDWFVSGESVTRGGRTSSYSSLVHYGCQLPLFLTELEESIWAKPAIQFEPENLIILTDGTSGSAAGVFVKLMSFLRLGRVVVHGGDPDDNADIASVPLGSFSGAAVKSDDMLAQELSVAQLFCSLAKDETVPSMFGSQTYAFFELYPWDPILGAYELDKANSDVPLGYARHNADFSLPANWDFTGEIYHAVLPYFDSCADWEIQRDDLNCPNTNSFANAVLGHPCRMGTFDQTTCVLRGCVGGFYLSEDKQQCLPMPEEFDVIGWFIRLGASLLAVALVLLCCCCCCCCICCICCCYWCCCRKPPLEVEESSTPVVHRGESRGDVEMSDQTRPPPPTPEDGTGFVRLSGELGSADSVENTPSQTPSSVPRRLFPSAEASVAPIIHGDAGVYRDDVEDEIEESLL